MLEREALWRMVVDSMEKIRKGWREFSSHIKSEVGKGSKIRSWHDLWCGNQALKEAFPNLLNIAHVKDMLQ